MTDLGQGWTGRVGQRVVVRRRLPDGSATDVVGELLRVDGTGLHVAGRRGEVAVPLADVVVGRVVPPRPSRPAPPYRALSIGDLERVAALHWRAPESEPLGEGPGAWLLRAAGGFTGRANSALAAGDPGLALPAALGAVRAWYAVRGLPPRLALPRADPRAPGSPPPDAALLAALAAGVRAAGWRPRPGAGATVLTAPTAAPAPPPPPRDHEDRHDRAQPRRQGASYAVRLEPEPDAGWLAAYRYRGETLPPAGHALLVSAPEQVFASVLAAGHVVAVARGSLGGGWAGITAVEVDPAHRRRGLARLLLARLAAWAAARGARSVLVQVGEGNDALALYASAGFTVHHRYDYLTPPP